MQVNEVMTRDVKVTQPTATLQEAARLMAEADSGLVLIGENDRLLGTLTDRDIAVRGIAKGLGSDTPIREVMSEGVLYCYEDADLAEAANNMMSNEVRRLPVLNRDKRLVGVISMGDIAPQMRDAEAGDLLRNVAYN